MNIDRATETLVIINSVVLIVFLLLAIYVLIQAIMFIRKIKRLAEKAENLADAVESIGQAFKHASTPVAITKVLTTFAKAAASINKSKRRK